MHTNQSNFYRPEIDGLRPIAVSLVILFHLNIYPFSGGFIGVDVFFVISGYLITSLLLKEYDSTNTLSFKNFYNRRVRRLLPVLLTVLITNFILTKILFTPEDVAKVSLASLSALFFVSNFYFYNMNYFGSRYNGLLD